MSSRKYTLKQRAEDRERTRVRIVDAAMSLHEEVGPLNTTISAVAERAGVQRLTVYRHFPTDAELFSACSGRWLELNPPPDLSNLKQQDPIAAAHHALKALYRYYRGTEKMWTAAHRDVDRVPALKAPMEAFAAYLNDIRDQLLVRLDPPRAARARTAATLGHAVQFTTWKSLAGQRQSDAAMARLVTSWVLAAADPGSG